MMHTLRTIQLHLREGSAGLEFVSALYKVLLASTWLAGHANSTSSLFALIGKSFVGVWFLLLVGVVHLGAWTQPDRLPWIALRKVCSVVGIAVWVSLIYDLTTRGATATVILLAPVVLFLCVAIVRRSYTVE
jgi:hypothetical protein